MTIVSVVIPTYGRPVALNRCLESLAHQGAPWTTSDPSTESSTIPSRIDDFGPSAAILEIIVVDDGGLPPAVVPQNVIILRQANSGAAAARNRGVARATGEFIVFVDDDAILPPNWFAHGMTWFRQRPHMDGMAGAVVNRRQCGAAAQTNQEIIDAFRHESARSGRQVPFSTTNNLWLRRRAIDRGLRFDERFPKAGGEDRAYLILAEKLGLKIGLNDEVPAEHDHPESLPGFLRQQINYGRGAARLRRFSAGNRTEFSRTTVLKILARAALHHPENVHWLMISQVAVAWGLLCESINPTQPPETVI